MPSWAIHRKYERLVLGKEMPEVDEWLDAEHREIDEKLLEQVLEEYSSVLYHLKILEEVLGILGREATRIQVLKELLKKYMMLLMNKHDFWRQRDLAVPLMYIYRKYGPQWLQATILHILLDEVNTLIKEKKITDLPSIHKLLQSLKAVLSALPSEISKLATEIFEKFRNYLPQLLRDLTAVQTTTKKPTKIQVIYDPHHHELQPLITELHSLSELGIPITAKKTTDLTPDEARKIIEKIDNIAMKYKVAKKRRKDTTPIAYIDERGNLILEHGILVLVQYSDGTEMFYPHYLRRKEIGYTLVDIKDLLNTLELPQSP